MTNQRRESLSKILVTVLRKFHDVVVERGNYELHPIDDLTHQYQLTHSEYNNLQKLQYWGLLVKGHETGKWILTHTAKEFLAGQRHMAKHVFVAGGHKIGEEAERVFVRDVMGDDYVPAVLKKEDYTSNTTQPALFFQPAMERRAYWQ